MTNANRLVLVSAVIMTVAICFVGCSKGDGHLQGKVETVMQGGMGITFRHYLITRRVAYDLDFGTTNCVVAGMDKQKDDAMTFAIADKKGRELYTVKIHSDALYRAQGTTSDTTNRYGKLPVKTLGLTYFECVRPGKGENKLQGGLQVKGF